MKRVALFALFVLFFGITATGYAQGPDPITDPSWQARYWNNLDLSGNPVVTRFEGDPVYRDITGSFANGVNADGFSARFEKYIDVAAGTYRFNVTADDGIRVFVAGRPVIDQWKTQAATTYTYDIYIPGGNTEVKVEYYDDKGNAVAKVRWERVGNTTPPPSGTPTAGEVIVEDTSAGFVKGGSATSWRTAAEGSGNSLTWTRNNDVERPNYNYARWYPSLRANTRYEVFVYIPERYTTTTAAKYYIAHRDGVNSVIVNQSTNGNRWVSLGTYTFQGTNADYVSLNDITGERRLTSLIAYDAMKFVPR